MLNCLFVCVIEYLTILLFIILLIFCCTLQRLNIEENERSIVIDLRPYMDSAPYIVRLVSTYFLIFQYRFNNSYIIFTIKFQLNTMKILKTYTQRKCIQNVCILLYYK